MLITPRCYAQNTLTHKQPSNRLAIVVPKSLVLIALLYFASGSLVQAMLILLNVPLAVNGEVLMTAITSAVSLIPMLMSDGVGAEIQRPLASVIVGG